MITLVTPIDYRVELLPYHMSYYHNCGIRRFVYALWNGDRSPVKNVVEHTWHKLGLDGELFIRTSIDCNFSEYNGPAESTGINKIVDELVRHWCLITDLDEFCWTQSGFKRLVSKLEDDSKVAAHGRFIDRISNDNSWPDISGKLDDVFPLACDLSLVAKCNCHKVPLVKRGVMITGGHHSVDVNPCKIAYDAVEVHHFKWHKGVIGTLKTRYASYKQQQLGWASESLWLRDFFTSQANWSSFKWLNARPARKIGI